MYALNLDMARRILSVTYAEFAPPTAVIVGYLPPAVSAWAENPVGDMPREADISNYLWLGEYIYEPLPELPPLPPEPTVWDELDGAFQVGYNEGYAEGVNSAYDD